jgi:hypothetical protein
MADPQTFNLEILGACLAAGGLVGALASWGMDRLGHWLSKRMRGWITPLDVEADPYFCREYARDTLGPRDSVPPAAL